MKNSCHCRRSTVTTAAAGALSGWALLLMPKCPACVSAYMALGSGISLTAGQASGLRAVFIAACAIILTLSILKFFQLRLTTQTPSFPPKHPHD